MEFVILFGLILLNGVFAMSEMAIVSARKARLQQRIDAGSHGAKNAMELADDPERIAATMAKPMQILSNICYPLVFIFNGTSNLLLRLLGAKNAGDSHASAEEINVMLQQGADAGVFDKAEQKMVGNVFRLDAMRIGAIMTPRRDIEFLDVEDGIAETQRKLRAAKYQMWAINSHGKN